MDHEHLKRQLDILWSKVEGKLEDPAQSALRGERDFASAFELAQQEMQAEALNLLRSRFEKEKSYWENLLAAKEETLLRLNEGLASARARNDELQAKVNEAQEAQARLLQETFGTLDLQKRALGARIEQLESELSSARREATSLAQSLKEEQEIREALRLKWEEKEKEWQEDLDRRVQGMKQAEQNFLKAREGDLRDGEKLNQSLRDLQGQIAENKGLFEMEKLGLQNVISEKENQIARLSQDLDVLKAQLEKEREERRLAVVERERVSIEQREDNKRLVEELLKKEGRIQELQRELDALARAKEELAKGREELEKRDEELRRRREEWVESIRSQTTQQLGISSKIFDLFNKIEGGGSTLQLKSALKPPAMPPADWFKKEPAPEPQPAAPAARFRFSGVLEKALKFLGARQGLIIAGTGLALFAAVSLLLVFQGEGIKSLRAQKYLRQGNELYTRGDLQGSFASLQKAYELDPQNTIIQNSLTLVLGEVAHQEYQQGRYEAALNHIEFLNRMIPGDPDVLQLHNDVLSAMDRAAKSPAAPGSEPPGSRSLLQGLVRPSAKEQALTPEAMGNRR